jgi:hypothetical protein
MPNMQEGRGKPGEFENLSEGLFQGKLAICLKNSFWENGCCT